MRLLCRDEMTGLWEARRQVCRTPEAWAAVWADILSNRRPLPGHALPAAPAVDFTTEEVVVVALGSRGSGGYGIGIGEVVATAAGREVRVLERAPGAGEVCTQGFVAPVTAVAIPRAETPITFVTVSAP